MKSPTVRLAVAAATIVLIFGIAWYFSYKGGVLRPIRTPEESLSTIPMKIGPWEGKDIPVDEKLFEAIDAHEVLSRSYTNSENDVVLTLHGAVFNTFLRIIPHSPTNCYPASGWTSISNEPFSLDDSADDKGQAHLLCFEKEGASVYVLYWFQFGDHVIISTDDLANVRQIYRDEDTWPPIVKMMIQMPANRPEQAKQMLKEFADALYQKTKNFK